MAHYKKQSLFILYKKLIELYKVCWNWNWKTQINWIHKHKNPISIYDADNDKILVSNKVLFGKRGFKYFIDYKDGIKVKPLCVMLLKNIAYKREFDETQYVFFFDKNKELLEKYNET